MRRLALLFLLGALGCRQPEAELQAGLSVADTLRGDPGAGFARALAPRRFLFPADHGPHPEFRTEWWYFTGNLESPEGRRFGYQLTFFRNALAAAPPRRPSAWAARDVYLAHFALSDVGGGKFRSFERIRRANLGLAGARAEPFRVWLDGWSATMEGLKAASGDVAIDLALEPGKPPALQGEAGLSRKGDGAGQASYYYSLSRMPTRGTVKVGKATWRVAGASWMDREWSTSSLGADQVGWDWFAIQLDDGWDLMFYQLRRKDGSADPASRGSWISPAGEVTAIPAGELAIEVLGRWRSPRSGASYPAGWRLRSPLRNLDLTVRPALADQELDTSFRYWEGAVAVSGEAGGRAAAGRGYVELTGYGESGASDRAPR